MSPNKITLLYIFDLLFHVETPPSYCNTSFMQGVETDRISVTVTVGVTKTSDMAFTVLSTEPESDERSDVFSQPITEKIFSQIYGHRKSRPVRNTVALIYGEVRKTVKRESRRIAIRLTQSRER